MYATSIVMIFVIMHCVLGHRTTCQMCTTLVCQLLLFKKIDYCIINFLSPEPVCKPETYPRHLEFVFNLHQSATGYHVLKCSGSPS
jgi:hypothetical protein